MERGRGRGAVLRLMEWPQAVEWLGVLADVDAADVAVGCAEALNRKHAVDQSWVRGAPCLPASRR